LNCLYLLLILLYKLSMSLEDQIDELRERMRLLRECLSLQHPFYIVTLCTIFRFQRATVR
jgi:hypothetical protein